jgi:hypothetical protein
VQQITEAYRATLALTPPPGGSARKR